MTEKISVVVPIYKIPEDLLRRCIESIANQRLKDIEMLLVDDGSPDRSGKICDEYAGADNRIRAFHMQNSGVSVARNIGIENAKGQFILFVDPDDYLLEGCLEKIYAAALTAGLDILLFRKKTARSGDETPDERVQTVNKSQYHEYMIRTMNKQDGDYNIGMCWCKLFRRSFIIENNLRYEPGVNKVQDRLFVFDSYRCASSVATFNYYGYYYTENYAGSICRRYNHKIAPTLMNTAEKFHQHLAGDTAYVAAEWKMDIQFIDEMIQLYFAHKDNNASVGQSASQLRKVAEAEPFKSSIKNIHLGGLSKKLKVIAIMLKLRLYSVLIAIFRINCGKNLQ